MTTGQKLLLVLIAGVALGVTSPIGSVTGISLAIGLGSLALLAASRPAVARTCLAGALGALAVAHGAAARAHALAPPLTRWADARAGGDPRAADPVRVSGRLAADAAAGALGVRLEINVEALNAGGGWEPVRGRVQAHVAGDAARPRVPEWTSGRIVEAPVLLRAPALYRNPGGASPVWQALRRDFDLGGTIKSAGLVEIQPARWWAEAAAAVRRHVREAVRHHIAPGDAAAAIVTAILIGDRAGLTDEIAADLQKAGTYHVIAISGGNIALLTALTLLGLRAVVRSRRVATLAALLVVLCYGAIVSGDPSVRRAVMAASLYLLVDLAGLAPSAMAVLAVVAAVLVVVDPLAVVDVGAWLSFGATLAIVTGASRLAALAHGPPRWLRPVIALTAATIAAEIALLPIQAGVFNRITVAGLALNLIAIPAMALLQVAGLVMVGCAGWFDVAASVAGAVASLGARVLVDSAALVRLAPWVSWRVPPAHWSWCAAYYAGWALLAWRIRPGFARRMVTGAIAVSTLVIATAPWQARAAPRTPWVRMTLIDVGQGDAILVQFPTGHSMLVDTGGTPGPFDIGGRIVTPAAWALGVRRLDWLVVTHGDGDHLGGARAVLADLRPSEVWEGIAVGGHRDLAALRDDAQAVGAVWRTVLAGQSMTVGAVTVESVHPLPPDWERRRVRNDDSLVLRLRYGEVELLLTGDAASEFEGLAASAPVTTSAGDGHGLRILKVAHHGSRTSSSAAFVGRYQPEIAVVSLGANNLFGHPAPEVVRRFADVGTRVFRTDRHGAIAIETDGRRARVRTWTGTTWEVTLADVPQPAGS